MGLAVCEPGSAGLPFVRGLARTVRVWAQLRVEHADQVRDRGNATSRRRLSDDDLEEAGQLSVHWPARLQLILFAGISVHGSLDGEARGGADVSHLPAGSRVVRISAFKDAGRIVFRGGTALVLHGQRRLIGLRQLPLILVSS